MSLHFLVRKLRRFHSDENGPTAVEYAVMLAVLVGFMMASIVYVGSEAGAFSDHVADELGTALEE